MESSHEYLIDDWLVHAAFGIGQIVGIEEKGISGTSVAYFKIRTTDSTFWVPVDRMDGEEMRPLFGIADIQLVIAALLRPPRAMPSNSQMRKNEIQRVLLLNSPVDSARLVRDLRARQRERGSLNLEELNAMRSLKRRLVEEWGMVTGSSADTIDSEIDDLLNARQPPAN
ncbi:MAG: CarD family transcriptional regulator [Candidatus Promineifilaceae bacterium]